MYTLSERMESWFWFAMATVTTWFPVVYTGMMAGLAIWVVRHRVLPGFRWLGAGFGVITIADAVNRIARLIAFPDYMVDGEFGKNFPTWVYTIDGVALNVRFICCIVIAFGFWKLCNYLVRGTADATPITHIESVPEN